MNIITNDPGKCTIAAVALRNVMDPEIGLNIVDLGLINQVDFDEPANNIYVSMTLTTQFCPMGESIVDATKNALRLVFTGDTVNVSLTFNPPWNSERISEEGQKFLNG